MIYIIIAAVGGFLFLRHKVATTKVVATKIKKKDILTTILTKAAVATAGVQIPVYKTDEKGNITNVDKAGQAIAKKNLATERDYLLTRAMKLEAINRHNADVKAAKATATATVAWGGVQHIKI